MRIILFFSIVLLAQTVTAQTVSNVLYVNEESKEFVYIMDDRIKFRLSNKDAFGSFSIATGHFESKGRNKYYIKSEHIAEETSTVDINARKDSLITVKVHYIDNSPIISAYVYFQEVNNPEKDFEIVCVIDTSGVIELSDNQVSNLCNMKILWHVEALGFSTKKKIVIKKGNEYTIRSVVPKEYPFTLFKEGKILINEISLQEIEVEILRKKSERTSRGTTKLFKVEDSKIPREMKNWEWLNTGN